MTVSPRPLRLAVVGINNQGEDHIQAILKTPGACLAAIVDRDVGLLEKRLAKGDLDPAVRKFKKMKNAAKDPEIDALIVALPHHKHLKAVKWAARNGKHLLKEKPLARNAREGNEMVSIARENNMVLHTGVQRRHHLTYLKLKEALKEESILSAHLEIRVVDQKNRPGEHQGQTWRENINDAGGGVLIDLGYHGIDLLHYLLGPMDLLSCTAWTEGRPTEVEVTEKNARVFARAGHVPVHMIFGRGEQKEETLVIETRKGVFLADREKIHFATDEGQKQLIEKAEENWELTMEDQLQSFIQAVNENQGSINDTSEQTPTIRFIEKCYASRRGDGLAGREKFKK